MSKLQKESLSQRYKFLLHGYRGRACRYSYAYHGLRVMITIGSLIVPALLSVQYTGVGPSADEVYWIVWTLSLLVTISNGIVTLLKVDKKYFSLNTTYQLLLSEGWQFIELSGRFSGFFTPGQEPTHENQYKYFCHFIEKVRMKQVEDEYYKAPEQGHHGSSTTSGTGTASDSVVPPTPQKDVLKSQGHVNASSSAQDDARAVGAARIRRQNTAPSALGAAAPILPAITESAGESGGAE